MQAPNAIGKAAAQHGEMHTRAGLTDEGASATRGLTLFWIKLWNHCGPTKSAGPTETWPAQMELVGGCFPFPSCIQTREIFIFNLFLKTISKINTFFIFENSEARWNVVERRAVPGRRLRVYIFEEQPLKWLIQGGVI